MTTAPPKIPVNIFVASGSELIAERKESVQVVHELRKSFNSLDLEAVEWETDIPSGSSDKQRIQDDINPLLDKCQIVLVLFFSKIGEFTLEEYRLAREKNKKVFLYFKTGFAPKNEKEHDELGKVFEFRDEIEKENRLIFKDFDSTEDFKNLLYRHLSLYLSQNFIPVPVTDPVQVKELDEKENKKPKKVKSKYYESFCDNYYWDKLEKRGNSDIQFYDEGNEIVASGMFTYLLSNWSYDGRDNFIIKTKLIFENYEMFKDDGSETANSGIVFAWSKNERGNEYLNLLFNGKRILLEEVGYQDGEHFYDYKHLDDGIEFYIVDGKEYDIRIQIQRMKLDLFLDGKWIYSKKLLREPVGKVGLRPWRAKLRCRQFEVEQIK